MAESTKEGKLECSENNPVNKSKTRTLSFPNHVLRRRRPHCFSKTKKDFYVTNKRSLKGQLNRCEKYFNSGESEIIIHGLGAAVNRACVLALQLIKNHNGILDIEINTSTVQLTDDLQPLTDDCDNCINNRNKSAIHIRVFRTVEIGSLKYAS